MRRYLPCKESVIPAFAGMTARFSYIAGWAMPLAAQAALTVL